MNDMTIPTAAAPTALTLPERAAKALGSEKLEIELADLVKLSVDVVEIKNADGREQAHRMGMNLKNARIAIKNDSEAVRKDATAFGKSIAVEEARLIGLISPEEVRIFALRDGWDTKIVNERQALVDAEVLRMSAIEEAIEGVKARGAKAAGLESSVLVQQEIDELTAFEITPEVFQERLDLGVATKAMTLSGMRAVLAIRVEAEAEAQRVIADRAELELLRKMVAAPAAIAPPVGTPEPAAAAPAPSARRALPFQTERNQAMGVQRVVLDPAAAWPKPAVAALNAQASLIDDLPDHAADPDDDEIIQLMATTYNMTVNQVQARLVRLVDALVEQQ